MVEPFLNFGGPLEHCRRHRFLPMFEKGGITMSNIRKLVLVLGVLLLCVQEVGGAREVVFGLDSVTITGVFDPNAWSQRLLLVSGSLKLTGGYLQGNVWETVTYVPQRPAAPRSDRGIFQVGGNRIQFFSFLTFSTFYGTVTNNGEKIVIERVNNAGQKQTEVWTFER